jgi:hypothetical protein
VRCGPPRGRTVTSATITRPEIATAAPLTPSVGRQRRADDDHGPTITDPTARRSAERYDDRSARQRLRAGGGAHAGACSAPAPQVSASVANAIGSARSYLGYAGFSREGLIEQLEYEGYTSEQAEYGVSRTYG